MTKQEILKELNKGKTYKEIREIAQSLIYKLSHIEIKRILTGGFHYLSKEELEKLGYEVYEVGTSEPEKLKNNLKRRGYLYIYDVFFSPENKEVWSVKNYVESSYIDLIKIFLNPQEPNNLSKLMTKNQYVELLADKIELLVEKIMKKLERWNKLKSCFKSLTKDEKKIEEALQKAQNEGLIK